MPATNWKRIKELFLAAFELPAADRDAFLRRECEDVSVADQVRALLAGNEAVASDGGAGSDSDERSTIGKVHGNYRVLRRLGAGGFGTVYAAEQLLPIRRLVALKVLNAGVDEEMLARFELERQALALVDHPNISRVIDAGVTEAGAPFFVMELVEGVPITEFADRARMSVEDRVRLFVDVVRAVQHAHQKGIIHRDLKPGNVLVTTATGEPVVKVIDFGIAKVMEGHLLRAAPRTGMLQLMGTPLYMSPEQAHAMAGSVDIRSDVYTLGVLLYELLVGDTPFARSRLRDAGLPELGRFLRDETAQRPSARVAALASDTGRITSCRRVTVSSLVRQLRGDLDRIVMKCLTKEPEQRYATAQDLLRDLELHLAGSPILAMSPSIAYRVRKFVRRRRALVIAMVAVVVVAAVGAGATFGEAVRRHRAELDRARIERREAATSSFTQACLHLDLGEWEAALLELNRAEQLGYEHVQAELARVTAWSASADHAAAERALGNLRDRPDLGSCAAMVHLLWIDPSRPRPEGAPPIGWREPMRALAGELSLPSPWRSYARSLIAPTPAAAIEVLRDVLVQQPRHRPAAELLLWLVLLQEGPRIARREAERFLLLWPNDDLGRTYVATCDKILGQDAAAAALIEGVGSAELVAVHESVSNWAATLRSAHRRARQAMFTQRKPSNAMALWQMLGLAASMRGPDLMNHVVRVHPTVAGLTQWLTAEMPGLLSRRAPALGEQSGLPSLESVSGLMDVRHGRPADGLARLEALLDSGREDIVAAQEDFAAVHLIALHSFAATLTKRGSIPAAEAEASRALMLRHARVSFAHSRTFALVEWRTLSEVTSFIGDSWMTRECVAKVMRSPDLNDYERLAVVASLIRVNRLDDAEEILAPIRTTDPDNRDVLRYTGWIEDRRRGMPASSSSVMRGSDAAMPEVK